MKTTPNYGLKKPETSDYYNVADFNHNADAIDAALLENKNLIGNHAAQHSVGGADPITPAMIGASGGTNILVNWFLANPIDERQGVVPDGNGGFVRGYNRASYTADRWSLNGSEFNAQLEDGFRIIHTKGKWTRVSQMIDNPERFAGKKLTLSALVSGESEGTAPTQCCMYVFDKGNNGSGLGTAQTLAGKLSLITHTLKDPLAENLTKLTFEIGMATGAESGYLDIHAVKLEVGETQSLARQDKNGNWVLNDTPPNTQEELLRCIRSTADSTDTYANKQLVTADQMANSLSSLSEAMLADGHVWMRRKYEMMTEPARSEVDSLRNLNGMLYSGSGATIYYADDCTVDYKTGVFELSGEIGSMQTNIGDELRPWYNVWEEKPYLMVGTTKGLTLYYVTNVASGSIWLEDHSGCEMTVKPTVGAWELVFSVDPNAYPKSGIVDGYEYEYRGASTSAMCGAKITHGFYYGTGSCGADNPCTLTFDFKPKFVMVYSDGMQLMEHTSKNTIVAAYPAKTSRRSCVYSSSNTVYGAEDHFTWGETSLSWYSTPISGSGSEAMQLNAAGAIYHYIAIG